MSKRLFKTMVAVLAIAAAAAGPVRGQNASPDVTLDFTTNDWALPTTGTNHGPEDYSNGTYSITLYTPSSGTSTYRFNSGYLLLGRSGAYLQLPAFSSPVEKIEVVGTSVASAYVEQNVFVDENNEWVAVSTQTMGMKDTTQTYVIDENYRAAGNIYFIKVESSANTQITYIKVYYVSSGGGSTPEPPAPAVPHTVRFASGNDGWQVQDVTAGSAAVTAPAVLQNVMAGDSLVVTAPATLPGKVKSVKAVKYVPPVLVQSIVLDKQTAFLAKDSTMTLSVASVLPENAADKSYTWSSDATGVASVNQNGVVTGMDAGTANIIATANDGSGVADTCVVTVLRSAILDGVTVLYASNYDNESWSTVIGYNPGVLYQDDDDNVRLTSNGAFLYHDGLPVDVLQNFYTGSNGYQWLRVVDIWGSKFYYRQGETWQQAIDAGRMYNEMWSIEGGQVKNLMQTLVDSNYNPVDPAATIDPSTVNYYLW